eukprot:COSAG01_NODE_5528_length_4204_cov_9.376249_3_plen_159_part_00
MRRQLNGLGTTTTLGQHRMTLFDIMAAESRADTDEAPADTGLTTARTIQRSPLRQSLDRSIEELEALILAQKRNGQDTTRTLDPLRESILERIAADSAKDADEKHAGEDADRLPKRKKLTTEGASERSSGDDAGEECGVRRARRGVRRRAADEGRAAE